MGNCQAAGAAVLVIQHPSGKIERCYWEISVSEVMKMNPGHYVSLIISLPDETQQQGSSKEVEEKKKSGGIRYTRVKLLLPTDTLVLGQAYRLVTTQEVMRVVQAKKKSRMKDRELQESAEKLCHEDDQGPTMKLDKAQEVTMERDQAKTVQINTVAVGKINSWRPSLQSISEAGS